MTAVLLSVRWTATALLAVLLAAGCRADRSAGGPQSPGRRSVPDADSARPDASGTAGTPRADASTSNPVLVHATAQGIWWGKPPLKTHFLNVTVHNRGGEPRWIALAETFPYEGTNDPRIGKGEVAELQVFELSRSPRVVLVLTVALGGVWALRLPAGARVEIRRLPVDSWWEDVPTAAQLEFLSAREIRVGGQPLSTCFDVEATSESGADVEAPRDAADPRMVPERCPSGDDPLPIEFVDERRGVVSVPLRSGRGP